MTWKRSDLLDKKTSTTTAHINKQKVLDRPTLADAVGQTEILFLNEMLKQYQHIHFDGNCFSVKLNQANNKNIRGVKCTDEKCNNVHEHAKIARNSFAPTINLVICIGACLLGVKWVSNKGKGFVESMIRPPLSRLQLHASRKIPGKLQSLSDSFAPRHCVAYKSFPVQHKVISRNSSNKYN
uniref:Uncharacterized protein n=1 Tax=Glossina pallidipes TaxID=7398 RepID=A0A1A9ZZ47_GLOPL